MSVPLLVMAAGGTGGHMFPAQALAEEMLGRGWRVKLSTDARGARYTAAFPSAVEITEVDSATFARGGALAKLAVPFRVLGGILRASTQMHDDRPTVVVGFGGYPSIPALGAAWLMRLPRMIHEQNGVLGRVNKVFAKRVQALACGTWPTDLPAGVKGRHTGNPVRSAVLDAADTAYDPPKDGPLRVLVIGGSQGARILSDVVPAALAALPDALRARLNVTHQARPEDLDRVTAAYAEAGIAATVESFFNDVPERLAGAHLMISRAGASTVAEIGVIGRPAILVPFAAATGDHQTANARSLVEAGAATAIQESALDADRLAREVTEVLTAPEKAATMAQAARSVGKPKAAAELADLAEDLAH